MRRRPLFIAVVSTPFLAWISGHAYAAKQIDAYGILNRHNARIEARTPKEAVYLEMLFVALSYGDVGKMGVWSRPRSLRRLARELRIARESAA